ncbi:MAG: aspartate aminotransferase family protein [Gammaproteobacteria bacterium]|nr:aspartate aminotransferase family protein [Gammaproteobacteria bacterium]MDH3856991.1 aspartate aminotransferase family protein [Gammaproteobacteria bacterium]
MSITHKQSPERSEGDVNLSPRRSAWAENHLDENTEAMLAEDAKYFLHQSLSTPCLNAIRASQGIYLEDVQGRKIMDFHGNSVHQVGHGHPRVIAAIKAQLDTLPFCPRRYTNQVAIDLARRLVELAPGELSKVLFAPGGTSAIGMALKLARYATGRHKTVSMWDSFHGASLDAISIGGEALFRKDVGPLLPGTEHIPPPTRGKCLFNCEDEQHSGCLEYLEYLFDMQGDVAALIAEPMRWTTVEPPPPGYWKKVREICDRHGVLLIFDEIPSALGRTGKMFVCEHFDVVPDMLVIGKGFGGGVFPMAALITTAALDIVGDRALGHYTHEKSSVGCAAALATLDCLQQDGLIENSIELGRHALARLQTMQNKLPIIHEVRGLGLHLGIELRRNGEAACDEADTVLYHSLSQGLSYKVGGGCVLTLCPPMTITRQELDQALDIVEAGIRSLD